jgi:signal transduction histidine kinase
MESVCCNDVESDPRHDPPTLDYMDFRVKTLLAVPIAVYGKLLGVLQVMNRLDDLPLTQDDRVFLEFFATTSGAAIENARLFEELKQRLEEASALLEASRSLTSLDFQSLLDAIIKRLCEVSHTDMAAIFLLDESGQYLMPLRTRGYETEGGRSIHFMVGEGTVGWVAEHKTTLRIDDVSKDPRFAVITSEASRFHNILGVPMLDNERLIGVLQVANKQEGADFGPADEKFLAAFANHAALAIHNAQLHMETEHHLTEVTTLFNVATNITSFHEMESVLNSTVSLLRESLGCNRCYILLMQGNEYELYPPDENLRDEERQYVLRKNDLVRKSKQPLNIVDAWAELGEEEKEEAAKLLPEIRSLVVTPLLVKGEVIGFLCIDSREKGRFGPAEERLLTIAASQISIAIENARLVDNLRDRAVELEVANQDLEELNRLKSEVVQNVSHELRTPLTFVKGYVELILEDYGEMLPSPVGTYLMNVKNKTDTVTHLVDGIIALEQLERGSLEMKLSSLEELAALYVQDARATARKHGIEIKTEFEPSLPPVWVDPERIGQVFDNLLGNAIKFMPNGGTITVWVRRNGQYLEAGVSDQGVGIPEDKLNRIFERFYQVDGSTKRRYGGAGLGLSIVKKIIELHGGRADVESEEGVGSIFSFTLPVAPDYSLAGKAT